jgi:uncharacterized protein with PIN domain
MSEELVGEVKVLKVGVTALSFEGETGKVSTLQPRCLECDGPLEKREFCDEFGPDGVTPAEDSIEENWYCPVCGYRWLPMEETPYKRPS